MTMNDETKADIKSLFDYGTTTEMQAGTMGKDWNGPLARASSAATAGQSGITEAIRFGQKMGGAVQALNEFMSDACKGATFLGTGALTIADHYVTADMSMAKEMTTVADAFMPTSDKSMGREASESEFAAQRDAYFHPQIKDGAKPLPPPTEVNYSGPNEKSPSQDATDHHQKYYRSETWHPIDPKAPVEYTMEFDDDDSPDHFVSAG